MTNLNEDQKHEFCPSIYSLMIAQHLVLHMYKRLLKFTLVDQRGFIGIYSASRPNRVVQQKLSSGLHE